MEELSSGVDLLAIVLCVLFLAYVVSIVFPFLRRKPDRPGNAEEFGWHLILPCLDEEVVIARTVRRLRSDHPRAHLWCVDDDSADATGRILAGLQAADPWVHLISRRAPQARQGKGAALNAAWQEICRWVSEQDGDVDPARVIVGVVDADGRLAPDALDVIAGADGFGDPRIGAVQIQVRMMNRGLDRIDASDPAADTPVKRLLVTLQDLEFRTVISAMQNLRHRMGSAGMGGNGQFSRLQVLNEIAEDNATPWHGALLEDFELGLHVLLAGWGNKYCNDTWVAQEGLPSVRLLVRQRARWAQGGMQCAKYFREVLTSSRVSTPSAIEISYFLLIPWTQLIGTLVYAASGAILIYWALAFPGGPWAWFLAGAWGLVPLILAFGFGPLVIWGLVYRSRCEPSLSRRAAMGLGLAYWAYTYVMLAAVWSAFWKLLRAREGWAKTERVLVLTAAQERSTAAAQEAPPVAKIDGSTSGVSVAGTGSRPRARRSAPPPTMVSPPTAANSTARPAARQASSPPGASPGPAIAAAMAISRPHPAPRRPGPRPGETAERSLPSQRFPEDRYGVA